MIYKIYTEDGLRSALEECLSSETGSNEKMELVLLKQAALRFNSHGMTGEDFDNKRLHDCIIDLVKDNYDNFLEQYYNLPDDIQNKDDVDRLFENTCEEVESLLDNIEKAASEEECARIQTEVDSILDSVREQLNIN